MNANQTRRFTEFQNRLRYSKQLHLILHTIHKAAMAGEFHCYYNHEIPAEVQEILIEDGYHITPYKTPESPEGVFKIKW